MQGGSNKRVSKNVPLQLIFVRFQWNACGTTQIL